MSDTDAKRFLLGSLDAMQNRYDRAVQHYSAILDAAPRHYATLDAVARCYDHLGQWDSVLTFGRRALHQPVGTESNRVDLLKRVARASLRNGNLDETIRLYQNVLSLRPDDAEAHFMIARAVHGTDTARARSHYRYILDRVDDHQSSLFALYELDAALRDDSSVASVMSRLIESDPFSHVPYDLAQHYWIATSDHTRLAVVLAQSMRFLPETEASMLLESGLQTLHGELESAREIDRPIQRICSTYVSLIVGRKLDRIRIARPAVQIAVQLQLWDMADSLYASMAIDSLRGADLVAEGIAFYLKGGQIRRAQRTFGRFIDNGSTRSDRLYQGARLALASGDTSVAIGRLKEAVERNVDLADAWSMLGSLEGATGNLGEAVQAFERAVQLEPNDGSIALDYAYCLLRTDFQPDKAQRMLNVAQSSADLTGDPRIHAALGRIAFLGGRLETALSYLREALQRDDSNPLHRAWLVQAEKAQVDSE